MLMTSDDITRKVVVPPIPAVLLLLLPSFPPSLGAKRGHKKKLGMCVAPRSTAQPGLYLPSLPLIWRFSSSSSSCFSSSSAFFFIFFFSFFFLFLDMLVVLGVCNSLGAVLTANADKSSKKIIYQLFQYVPG